MPPRASNRAGRKSSSKPSKQKVTTPILLQMHATECGAACLGSVLGHFGRFVPLTELREKCEVSRDGSSAASIARAARHYGLECKGLSVRADQLKLLPLPLILFWQFSHFLVLEGIDDDNFYLNDPATGRRTLSADEFVRSFSGIALRFKRGDDFKPGGERPDLFTQLGALLDGSLRVLAGVIACGLMLTLLALVIPASVSVFVDDVLANHGPWGGLVAALIGGGVLVSGRLEVKQAVRRRRVEVPLSLNQTAGDEVAQSTSHRILDHGVGADSRAASQVVRPLLE